MQICYQNRKHFKIMAHKTVKFTRKKLADFKVIHVLLITKLRNNTIDLFYKIQKNFIL